MSFRHELVGQIRLWTGDPDCDAAMTALAAHLSGCLTPRLPTGVAFGVAQIGNLGETLAFLIGRATSHPESTHRMMGDNASNPLMSSSRTGLDLLWLYFDPVDPSNDRAWIQEVKTTVDNLTASYISALIDDYSKLFGLHWQLSLDARLGDAAWRLRQFAAAPELARRALALGGRTPTGAARVFLTPTGVHDLGVDAITVMENVRIALIDELGWGEERVEPHLIAVSRIGERLRSLAQ